MVNLWVMLLRGLSVLAVNPALGGGGMRREEIAQYLNYAADLVARGEEAFEALKAFAEEIDQMAKNNVQPSDKDFERLKARSESAWDRIQAAKTKVKTKTKTKAETDPPPAPGPNEPVTE